MELGQILATTALIFTISGIVCAFLAVLETRTTQGAIAWAISLVTFPYLAVPLYLVFGRRKAQVGIRKTNHFLRVVSFLFRGYYISISNNVIHGVQTGGGEISQPCYLDRRRL